MDLNQPQNAYLTMQVRTSNRMEIIASLYELALLCISQAMEAMESGNCSRAGEKIGKAGEILIALCEALDYSQPGDIAPALFSIYHFHLRQLLEANRTSAIAPLQSARSGLSMLLAGWRQIENSEAAKEIREADARAQRQSPRLNVYSGVSPALALSA